MAAPTSRAQAAQLDVESSDSAGKPEDYIVVDGYRMVKPYHFDFCCSVKQRWFGQNIIDIFTREFPARDRAYYLQALADGRLRVDGCQVTPETPLRDGQRMRHLIHRHEPPVPAGSIQVVGESAAAVAVCKPHGMPVHVAGQYRKNTVLGILTAERPDLGPLFPIHRLDKPVSGLLLFARSPAAAAALCSKIEGREVEKVYVARVLGRFPSSDEAIVADVPLAWDPVANHATAEPGAAVDEENRAVGAAGGAPMPAAAGAQAAEAEDGRQGISLEVALHQEQPEPAGRQDVQQQAQQSQQDQQPQQQPVSRNEERRQRKQAQKQQRKLAKAERQAAAAVAASAAAKKPSKGAAKPAVTEFRLLAVAEDGLTSIVECRPRTGRTHQIRVHLQYLGHPIANDVQYGGTYGGPQGSRQMAQQLGVHWAANPAQEVGGAGNGAAGGSSSRSGVSVVAGAVSEGGSKRARLEVATAANEAGSQPAVATAAADANAVGSAAAAQSAAAQSAAAPDGVAAAATTQVGSGQRCTAGQDVYALNLAFRSRPEYQVAAELRDALCIHCPYYAPKDYPLDLRPLWLHARTYSCQEEGWSFSTDLPEWAHADWLPPA